jgi:RNA polymerase sigma-54 factor
MALSARLEMRQSQQLVMTPQLQQAIKLLQLSNIELSHFVEAEIERNPLLEHSATDNGPAGAEAQPAAPDQREMDDFGSERATSSAGDALPVEWSGVAEAQADPAAALDTDFDNVFPDTARADAVPGSDSGWTGVRQTGTGSGASGEDSNLEEYVSGQLSLKDHLEQQLALAITNPGERLIGAYLVDMVDEAGYLQGDLAGLAERLGAPLPLIEDLLGRLQLFDPPGVFARSLAECLALQLRDQNRYDPQIAALLKNLDLLAAHNLGPLKRACQCDATELAEMIAEIKQLDPKPGLKFGHTQIQPVVPDVIVRPRLDGGWLVELNSDTLPRVLVNQSYFAMVNSSAKRDGDKTYLQECLQTANWLVKSLDQRARTILRVSEEIVRQQDAFFAHGVQYLRPLNLKTVADAISMHESTVSRVTSNKYMATNRGIFELKYFFTSSINNSEDGEAHSSEAVRYRIKQLIDGEPVNDVLSDDKIVEKLKSDGIDIARRTVAKYREAMRISSSVLRRREKRLANHASAH